MGGGNKVRLRISPAGKTLLAFAFRGVFRGVFEGSPSNCLSDRAISFLSWTSFERPGETKISCIGVSFGALPVD